VAFHATLKATVVLAILIERGGFIGGEHLLRPRSLRGSTNEPSRESSLEVHGQAAGPLSQRQANGSWLLVKSLCPVMPPLLASDISLARSVA
jgi:hypothetical protein